MRTDREVDLILLAGSGRSGTTLLLNLLVSTRELSGVPALAGAFPRLARPGTALSRRGLLPRRLERASSECVGVFRYLGFDSRWREEVDLPAQASDMPTTAPQRAGQFVARVRAANADDSLLVLKSTANCYRLAPVLRAFGFPSVVHIIRDPHEVVGSLLRIEFWPTLRLWWCGATPVELEDAGVPQAATAFRHWLYQVRAVEDVISTSTASAVRVFYDRLLVDPEGEVERIGRETGMRVHFPENDSLPIDVGRQSAQPNRVWADVPDSLIAEAEELYLRLRSAQT